MIDLQPPMQIEEWPVSRLCLPPTPSTADDVADPAVSLEKLVGLPLVIVSPVGMFPGSAPPWLPGDAAEKFGSLGRSAIVVSNAGVDVAAVRLRGSAGVAAVLLPPERGTLPAELIVAAAEAGWTNEQLREWRTLTAGRRPDDVLRRVELAADLQAAEAERSRAEWELESLSEHLDNTYEEVSLLHFLAQNLEVSRDTNELAGVCLSRMRESLVCEGATLWLHHRNGQTAFLQDGETPYDEFGLAMMLSRYDSHPWPRPLVRNDIGQSDEGGEGVESLVIAPIMSDGQRSGWVVCVNAGGGREFGTVEASLVASVAVSLGTHIQNAAVLHQQEELLLSFVRSLVSSLDAKDPYTRGHSERVAAIGRRLAEELGLSGSEAEDVYLSGLLHDVGKIGVSDAVLRKPGRLTDAEFAEIQTHPSIGYQILGGIKRLSHILPGVRSHHESVDGSGYPDGLAGTEIPFMARILAVADSFDAMGSDRPYRTGMPLEKVERILRDGAGTQWDEQIVDAYFRCREDIMAICLDWQARQSG